MGEEIKFPPSFDMLLCYPPIRMAYFIIGKEKRNLIYFESGTFKKSLLFEETQYIIELCVNNRKSLPPEADLFQTPLPSGEGDQSAFSTLSFILPHQGGENCGRWKFFHYL
jgi:hypothetical protein